MSKWQERAWWAGLSVKRRTKHAAARAGSPTAVYFPRMWTIMMMVMISATMCTKHVAAFAERGQWTTASAARKNRKEKEQRQHIQRREQRGTGRTWLEDEVTGDLDVARVAGGLDALLRAEQRTHDERGRAADVVERAEFHDRVNSNGSG